MTQPQALYVIGTGLFGAATAVVGEISRDQNIQNFGIVALAAAALAYVGGKLLAWLVDRAFKKFEYFEAIPEAIDGMRNEIRGQFTSMRTDMQAISGSFNTHVAVDAEWKKSATERDLELRRRLNELEKAQGWTVRGQGPTTLR